MDVVADQLDVQIHVVTHVINRDFAIAKAIARTWEPRPYPTRKEDNDGTRHVQ